MVTRGRFWLIFCFLVAAVVAYNDPGLPTDPYLAYKPVFARSLPVQILVTGVVFTLTSVLFVHLLFTGQYHWPLAPVNYVLQISGVITLLISLIATLNVVLKQTMTESSNWPYMVSYIAVSVPPSTEDVKNDPREWSIAERATWFIMTATTSVLVQTTHVQFLTLLYPSSLERRLIFSMLGPLAVLAAVMQLVPISSSAQVNDVASAIRNVCNATLSLLFTAALFVWGLLVNRKQAWRTDGGTAVFGAAALALAVASTALNFLYVPREEEYVWLPGLMWAVILWQSFLGWWWWVGSASGGAALEEREEKDATEQVIRRGQKISKRRRERQERRQQQQSETGSSRGTGWRSVFSSYGNDEIEEVPIRQRRRRRRQMDDDPHSHSDTPNSPTNDNSNTATSPSNNTSTRSPNRHRISCSQTEASSPSSGTTSHASTASSSFLPSVVYHWFASLRQAHLTAARIQAAERRERILELERAERERVRAEAQNRRRRGDGSSPAPSPWFRVGVPGTGWGLGSSGWRVAGENSSAEQVEMGVYPDRRRRRKVVTSDEEGEDAEESSSPRHRRVMRRADTDADIEVQNTDTDTNYSNYPALPIQTPQTLPQPAIDATPRKEQRSSVWWWGPFRRWRLQDSTVY